MHPHMATGTLPVTPSAQAAMYDEEKLPDEAKIVPLEIEVWPSHCRANTTPTMQACLIVFVSKAVHVL